jgi:hypothetical protein
VRLGSVNFNQRIGALTVATSTALAASDTNYWTVALLRLRTGQNPLTIATKTTKVTLGEGFTADQGWNLDATFWLETARHLRKGDVLAVSFTKTGTPASLADVTAAVRYEPGIQPLIRDTFTRPDSTTTLGATDTGQTWSTLVGTWGISGGAGYASAAPDYSFAVFDAARADYTLSVRVPVTAATLGLVFRAVDAQNLWTWESSGMYKTVGNVATQFFASGGWVAGDTLSVVCSASNVSGYKNGVLMGSVTDAALQTATKVGIYVGPGATGVRFDDLALAV